MIDVDNLYFRYPGSERHTLEEISFSVGPSTLTVITGPSGSGKSTFMRVLTGLIPHSMPGDIAGRVIVNNIETLSSSITELSRHVGCVFQNPEYQLYENTVADEFPFDRKPPEEIDHPQFRIFDIDHLYYRSVNELSSGEKQKVAITSILIQGQPILLLDEPLATLDHDSTIKLIETLASLRDDEGKTIIVIEHRWNLLAPVADQVITIEDGKLTKVQKAPIEVQSKSILVDEALKGEPRRENPRVSVEDVNFRYRRREPMILRDVNFQIGEGEVVGLVGPNGSGKSTLAKVLCGLRRPTDGKVTYHGKRRGEVGIAFQNPTYQLFCDTVTEEVEFARQNYRGTYVNSVEDLLSMLDIYKLKDKRSRDISHGEQQRVAFASAISFEPNLCILDEPTTGLDDRNIRRTAEFIFQMRSRGRSFMVISHDERFIDVVCDRVLSISKGSVRDD